MAGPREDAWSEFYANPSSEEDNERPSPTTPVPPRQPIDRPARPGEHPDIAQDRAWARFYADPNPEPHRDTNSSTTWDEFYGKDAGDQKQPATAPKPVAPQRSEAPAEPSDEEGAANPGWQPDYGKLDVGEGEVDTEAVELLRSAPLTDALRAEVTETWARAVRADEAYTADEGMAALRRACGSDARVAATIRDAHRALERAPDRIKDFLDTTQSGNHPALIQALAKVGRALRSGRKS